MSDKTGERKDDASPSSIALSPRMAPLKGVFMPTNSAAEEGKFLSLPDWVKSRGGTKVIQKILIANNGIAAVKAIRSMRKWSYETFGSDKVFEFIVMTTPEDMKANAQYIHLADNFIQVPAGPSINNFGNVELIVECAERVGAHAVWAGWGHASEKPQLPDSLKKTKTNIVWIGPPSSAMRALGDKIGSSLIAQAAGVPCVAWSGSGLDVKYDKEAGISQELYDKACVFDAKQAEAAAEKIGFPVMIKASEGGGGKGIRRVEKKEQVEAALRQVQSEVAGPVFVMRVASACRHLEVQLLADEWGNAIAVFGRDCSIQRRHQKIIEEGPVVAAPPEIWRDMERSAVRLAKEVGYCGVGTVEYLYAPNGEYYFLELNPRLQVEHPVTELISGVNLPACQLQVAMGIPLHRIPAIRRMYGHSVDDHSPIDFDNTPAKPLPGHVIACRITAENPDVEFQPTSGLIHELNFRSTPNVWGYFSVAAFGGVHEYADSQFGHLFALGETRDEARRNMVSALAELSIRGDIRTTVEYLRKLIEMEDFRRNQVDTMWLERVLARRQVERERPPPHLAALLGALFRAYKLSSSRLRDYVSSLERGQLPSASLNTDITDISLELIYEQTKYRFRVTKSGPNSFDLSIGTSWMVSADAHTLSDGGILVLLNGRKHVVYGQEFPSGLRLTVDGQTCLFREEYDPSSLRAAVQGKLVRFVVADGAHVNKDQAYAEVEVMKMIITLVAPEAGIIRLAKPEGAILEAGDLIAGLTLDDPHRVRKAELFNGTFPQMRTPSPASQKVHVQLKEVLAKIRMVLDGYLAGPGAAKALLKRLLECLRDPQLPLMQFRERMSTLSGRMPSSLYEALTNIGNTYASNLARDRFPWESREAFPVADLQEAIDSEALKLPKGDRATMAMHLADLTTLLAQYKDGNPSYAAQTLTDLLTDYYQVEQYFNDGRQPETVIKQLRKEKKDDLSSVMRVVRAHHQLIPRTELVMDILTTIELQLAPLVPNFLPVLKHLSSLNGRDLSLVVLKARQLIMRHELPSSTQRRIATQTILNSAAISGEASERLARLAPLIDQSQPIEDMIFSFFDEQKPVVLKTAMEVYIRRVYQAYAIPLLSVDYSAELGMLIGAWEFHAHKNVDEGVRGSGLAKSDSVVDIEKLAATERPGHGGPSRAPSSVSGRSSPPRKDSSPLLASAATPARTTSGERVAAAAAPEGRSRVASMDPAISHHNRLGVFAHFRDFDAMKKGFTAVARKFEAEAEQFTEPVHVLYLGFRWTGVMPSDDTASQYFHTFLKSNEEKITALGIRRVTFIVHTKAEEYPGYYTYRHRFGYSEDTNVRHIEPSYALHLQLQRMSNFDFRYVPSTNRLVHIFSATPLATPAAAKVGSGKEVKDNKSLPTPVTDALSPVTTTTVAAPVKPAAAVPVVKRFFVRALVRKLDSATLFAENDFSDDKELDSHPETEYAFVEALNSLEMAVKGDKSWRYNSIFLNVLVEATMPLRYVENIVRLLARRYSEKVRRLNVSMVEFTISLRTSPSQVKATTYHFVCTNPTGYVLNVDTYAQVRESGSKQVVFRQVRPSDGSRIGEAKGEVKSNEVKGYWDGQEVYAPYPVSEPFQRQRAAAEAADTVYVYDFPVLLERAIRATWLRTARNGGKSGSPQLKPASSRGKLSEDVSMPENVLKVVELVLAPNTSSPIGYELVEVSRPSGRNDIGMVAWKLTLHTPEYPRGRDVVLIANDISFMAGSFGPKEDYLFLLASQYARRRRIPRLYFTANSGARIGLADEVKPKFKIAWNNNDPFRGLAYLYLTEADYASLKDTVQATRVDADVDGKIEVRYQLTDVIGRKDGLNMENLRGSGMIAGETSQAYDDTFTLTFVTARTVGIGAYLARLGQRVIQKQTPPIILTGYMALNKLLGRSVYTSNLQLGGPDIMYTNGVTHWTVDNDMEGVLAVLRWLSYVPIAREESLPLTPSFAVVDPVDRKIAFKPTKLAYDPRGFLDGVYDDSKGESRWTGGFFDRDSWQELLGGWAREVVVGRARLGGIPMGVVAVETRTVEATIPADPAVNESKENILQRAGQVWFPASAFKTAQAIKDIVAEDLPLIVFANWRGFSGGMSDMFHEVLKYGSYIVDALRAVKQPVFVYIPPYGTLRGGAWVVVDPTINEQYMEMYADDQARGGVLEPEGTVEVMFKERDMIETMHRLDHKLVELDAELKRIGDTRSQAADDSRARIRADIKAREKALLPLYHQAATQFADLHDTPGRMQRKGVIRSPVKWENARTYFYWRLRRRLIETAIVRRIKAADSQYATEEGWRAANTLLQSWLQSEAIASGVTGGVRVLEDDRATVEWLETHNAWSDARIASLRSAALLREVSRLLDVGTSATAHAAPSTVAVPVLAELIKGLDGKQKQELGAALGIKLAA